MFVRTETVTAARVGGLPGERAPLEWRVAPGMPATPDGLVFGEGLATMVADALKAFHHVPRLGDGPLSAIQAVGRYQRACRLADDRLGRAYAVRAVLCQALARLAAQDSDAASLLEARYVRRKPIAHFEVEGHARATLLRRTRQALEQVTWELWVIEQEAREAEEEEDEHVNT